MLPPSSDTELFLLICVDVSRGQRERKCTGEISRAPGAFAESCSTALTNEVGGSVEVGGMWLVRG